MRVKWWYDDDFKLGANHKWYMEPFPIGQIKKKSKNQKVKVWSNFEFKWKRSKNAILNGKVLGHEIYIFGKRMKNVVCRKKPHQIWPYGLRDMACWSSKIDENELIISWQPHMGFESSWTFWKWENKIFNFHVGQKFIWSLYHDVSLGSRSFHFWQLKLQVHFLFLENFLIGLIFSHDEVWHDRWGLYKHEWTPSDQFYPSNPWLNPQLTNFDFLGFWTWLCTSDEFQTLIPWDFDFKWCPKTNELLIVDHGAQIP